jgi:hypothetical protein
MNIFYERDFKLLLDDTDANKVFSLVDRINGNALVGGVSELRV